MNSTRKPSELIELTDFRGNAREKILRTDLRFTVTKYFVERWIPNLGLYPKGFNFAARHSAGQAAGSSALFILDLRQFTLWENGKPVLISRDASARRLNKSVRTIQTISEEPLVKWFVKKLSKEYYTKDGRTLRRPNKYVVRQDEPLIPQDIENVICIWQEKKKETPEISALDLLKQTLDADIETLRAPNPTSALTHPEWFHNGALSILDAIRIIYPGEKVGPEIKKMADLVENAIIQAEKMIGGSKYFREKWMPKLGASGWLLLFLRNEGFLDEENKIERNLVKMKSPKKYAAILGISTDQIIRMLENNLSEWVKIKSTEKKSDQSLERIIKVFLREKLTPEDERKLYKLYEQAQTNEETQNVALTPAEVTQNVAFTDSEVLRNVALIQRLSSDTSSDEEKKHHQRQNHPPHRQPDNADGGGDEKIILPDELLTMLEEMGWSDTTSVIEKEYAQNSNQVLAWAKYTLQKDGLTNRAGYFRKRLLSGEKAPALPKTKDPGEDRNRYTSGKYAEFLD